MDQTAGAGDGDVVAVLGLVAVTAAWVSNWADDLTNTPGLGASGVQAATLRVVEAFRSVLRIEPGEISLVDAVAVSGPAVDGEAARELGLVLTPNHSSHWPETYTETEAVVMVDRPATVASDELLQETI